MTNFAKIVAVFLSIVLLTNSTNALARSESGLSKNKKLTPREREERRIAGVMIWAQENKVTEKEILQRIMAPILAGNKQDIERNKRLARQFFELAGQAKKERNSAAAKRYLAVADLFRECAKENRNFLVAWKAGNIMAVKNALKRLKACDDRIEQLTGKRVKRSWYMLDEMVNSITPPQTAAVKGKGDRTGK